MLVFSIYTIMQPSIKFIKNYEHFFDARCNHQTVTSEFWEESYSLTHKHSFLQILLGLVTYFHYCIVVISL